MRRAMAALAALCAVAVVAGCGGDSGGSSSGSGSGSSAKVGKGTVGMLLSSSVSESESKWAKTIKDALGQIGWKAVLADGKGDPAVFGQAITNFTNQRVDGIVTMAVDAAPITQQLKAAKEAGIPVIATGVSTDPSGKALFAATYSPSDDQFGNVLAAYLKKKFRAGTGYTTLDISAIYAAHAALAAADPILKQAGFKLLGSADVDQADPVNGATKGTANLAQAHPEQKFVLSCCDFTPPITVASLKQSGHPDVLSVARFDNQSSLKLIHDGAPLVLAVSNNDTGVLTALDQILAKKAGKSIDPNADKGKYKYVVVDKKNVPPAGKFVYDPVEQISGFVKKWKAEYGL